MLSSLPSAQNTACRGEFPASLADVTRRYAVVSPTLEGCIRRGALWQAAPGRFLLDVPSVARYLVEEGQRITIDAATFAHPLEIERFLRMTPLAALRYQRGSLAFHAAAVAGPSGAALIAGDSGTGKSALLANLMTRGWTMLADDIALADRDAEGRWWALPVYPEILLWRDTIDRLRAHSPDAAQNGLNATDWDAIEKTTEKTEEKSSAELSAANLKAAHTSGRRFALRAERFASTSCLLRGIYWLSLHSNLSSQCNFSSLSSDESGGAEGAEGIQIAEVQGAARFKAIGALAYNTHIADALLDREAYFRQALPLAGSVPIWRLQRPRARWTVEALAAHIARETG